MNQKQMKEMGQQFYEWRIAKDWSQALTAKKLGITGTYLSHLENGKSSPSLHLMYKIAALFNKKFIGVP